jgi:ankyrin repeat protein
MKLINFLIMLVMSLILTAFSGYTQDIFTEIKQGNIEKVKELIKKNPKLAYTRQGSIFPLHQAVRSGKIKIAELLISKGADINRFAKDATEFAPFEFTPMTEAIRANKIDFVKMFVDKGADLKKVTSMGESYLHFAAFFNKEGIADYLIGKGIDVNIKKRGNLTPLHIGAVTGHQKVVELLLKRGADINALSTDGGTPLHFARAAGHGETVELLKSKGAKDIPRNFPKYSGAYLGVKRPGLTPEPFASELFRDIYRVHSTPAFSPDGREVFWECIFMLGNNEVSRVWTMKENNGYWSEPRVAPFSKYPSGGPAFYHDGNQLIYDSTRPRDKSSEPAKDLDLWVVERSGNTWGRPMHLDTPLNSDKSFEVYPLLAGDGTIYLGIGRREYVKSAFVDGKYSAVEVIGDLFNTDYMDSCSTMDHILLFSDKRRQQRFEYEIFISFHKADGRWSKPIYLGDKLHPGRRATQAIVSLDRKYLFFVSYFHYYWVDARVIEEARPIE